MAGNHDQIKDTPTEAVAARSPAPPAGPLPIGNRAMGALLRAPGFPRGVVDPSAAVLLARRRVLARWTRDELLAAYRQALADAESDSSKWEEVALRLNGFNEGDIKRLAAALTVKQLTETKGAVERYLDGWPAQKMILNALEAGARGHNVELRPSSKTVWAAYSNVSYEVFPGEEARHDVWKFVGGNVGRDFDGENTCATRVSYGLNYGGLTIRGGLFFKNDPGTKFNGKAGDGKNYIVGARAMAKFLRQLWGPPDLSAKTNADVQAFEQTLRADQIAIFAGPHHSSVIKKGYSDGYVLDDPSVMPVESWKLP